MGGRGRKKDRYFLHWGKQGKHVPGHNNYDPEKSPITVSKEKLEELFNKYGGTGEKIGNKEKVNFKEVIGEAKSQITGETKSTTWGTIHYGKHGGYHIVPLYPKGE